MTSSPLHLGLLAMTGFLCLGLGHCASGNRKESKDAPSTASTPTPSPTGDDSNSTADNSTNSDNPEERVGDVTPGSVNNIGGVFQLLATKAVDADQTDDDYCDEEGNLGTVIRSTDGGDFVTCLGESLSFGQAQARYYKAFKTPPDFFRPLTGSITIIVTATTYDWQCYRLPEKRSRQGSADLGDTTSDLCGDVFDFTVAVPDGEKPGKITIEFNGGTPEPVNLGTF